MINNKVIFFPDYSGGNPYQKLLYEPCITAGVKVHAGDILLAMTEQERQGGVIFHIHWLNAIFKNCHDENSAWKEIGNFIRKINKFQRIGGKVIWTIHNHLPHEKKYSEQDLRLRHFLCQTANRIHLHCATHIDELDYLPLIKDNIRIHRHGNYIGYYGNFCIEDRLQGIERGEVKVLFLGMLRGYKGIDSLISNIRKIRETGADVTIAGNPESPEVKKIVEKFCSENGVRHILRRLSEKEVHELCVEHNVGILSYDRILTYGTLKLYLSYGMAVIAPSLRTIEAEDRYNSFIYINKDACWSDSLKKKELLKKASESYFLADENRWSFSLFERL